MNTVEKDLRRRMHSIRVNTWRCCVITMILLYFTHAIPIDNGVKGYPKVTCGLHSIRVDVDTEKPFEGRVYVKGESYNKDCIKSFAGTPPAGGPVPAPVPAYAPPPPVLPVAYGETVGIELGFGQCNMRRQRTLYPRGVEYTFTLVVSFHPLFLTKVDKAYRIRCFYMETEKTVAQQLDVSMLTTHQINEQFPMPQCRYHIKRGGAEGPYVRYARVGEPVHHVWECDAPAAWLYGILVKNCYVDDGQGNRVELLDERGCANDRHILPDLAYDQSLISAWVESHVFKYADKPHLFFTCTIVLCFKQDGGCNGITPPNCLGAPVLPVPGPYPAKPLPPPVPYAPPPPPPPAYGPPVPYAPYNRDAPPVTDENAINSTIVPTEQTSSTSTITSPSTTAIRKRISELLAKSDLSRHKRNSNDTNSLKTTISTKKPSRDIIETDLSAQPVIVLPFEDDGAYKEDGSDELHDVMHRVSALKRPYAIIPNIRGSGLPSGVCVSSSGFGVLVALFLALFILSTILTVIIVRRHATMINSKV